MTLQTLGEASYGRRRCLFLIQELLASLCSICASLGDHLLTSVLKSHAAIIDSQTMQFCCLNYGILRSFALVLELLSHFSCRLLLVYLHNHGRLLDFRIHQSHLARFEFIESSYNLIGRFSD